MSRSQVRLQQKQFELLEELKNLSEYDATERIHKYLEVAVQVDPIICPEISSNLKWFNVESQTLIARDDGRVTLIDFFTYCCINCLHILPTLRQLEQDFANSIEVIGYHSPKFENEKVELNVLNAVKRHDITHPVVCGDGKLWEELGIFCWPTVVITSPTGKVLFYLVGENVINEWLLLITQATTKFFSAGKSVQSVLKVAASGVSDVSKISFQLSFPGKVKASPDEILIAISDTGNNRILLIDEQGSVQNIIGGRSKGYIDGDCASSLFNSPQGIAWSADGQKLFVADTGNDVIRVVDLITKRVDSITLQIDMSSPWDIVLVDRDKLFVAMAGCHQIWLLALDQVQFGSRKWEKYAFKPFAGNGKEENRNNLYPMKAGFAQPSGLTYCWRQSLLFVADSESSSIRSIRLKDGAVKNVVGGSVDPLDLFAFGDQDGIGHDVRLQHPMDVSFDESNNSLLVADTYNHKIKRINPVKRECITVMDRVDKSSKYCEPSGMDIMWKSNILLVCDTNNHRLVKVVLNNEYLATEFVIEDLKPCKYSSYDQEILLGKFEVESGKELLLTFDFLLSSTVLLTKDSIHYLKLILSPIIWIDPPVDVIEFSDLKTIKPLTLVPRNLDCEGSTRIFIECTFFLCNRNNGTCSKRNLKFVIPLKITNSLKLWNKNQVIRVTHEIS